MPRRTNNRHALRHLRLVPPMRMQIPTTHKARLRRMRMYPPERQQILPVAVLPQPDLVRHLASVGGRVLLRDDEFRDEKGVGDKRAA